MSKIKNGGRLTDAQVGFLLIVPGLAFFIAIILYPFLDAIMTSFTDKSLLFPTYKIIGLENYEKVLSNPYFGKTVLTTVIFVLCDKSAFNYYKDLAEKGYYNRAISGNVNQRIEVDSIRCNFEVYPYEVTTYARQFIVRPSNITERNLITTCTLQNSVRSDNNPQGFLMEQFMVRQNQDVQTYKR